MPTGEPAGYLGKAQTALNKAKVQVGDRISIQTSNQTFEGIVIPRAEIGADNRNAPGPATDIDLDTGNENRSWIASA